MRLRRCAIVFVGLIACAPDSATSGEATSSGDMGPSVSATAEEATSGGSSMGTSVAEASSSTAFETDPFPPPPPPPASAFCGDGALQLDEECDDANDIDDDACTNTCVRTASVILDVLLESEGRGCADAVAVDTSGDLVVGGYAFPNRDMDAWLARLSADGEVLWSETWDGGGARYNERVEAIRLDANGDAYVSATRRTNTPQGYLHKWTSGGAEQWLVPVPTDPRAFSYAESLTTDADGSTTVVISHFGRPDGARVARFDADGAMAWPAVLDTGGTRHGTMQLHRAADGDLRLVTTVGTLGLEQRPRLERRTDDGTLVWSRTADPPLAWHEFASAVSADGSTSVVAHDLFDPEQLVIRSWSADGDGPQINVPGFERYICVEEAAYAADGSLYVVGNGWDGNDIQGWLLQLDPVGKLAWGRRHEREVNGLALTPEGDVVIVGCTEDDEQIWLRRYAG